jgi:hypothetical protein
MNAWSASQRQYLEAMGFQLWDIGRESAPLVPEMPVARTSVEAASVPAARPASAGNAVLSVQLQKHVSRAANLTFDDLVQRVYLPPDLATNPHAKRAFWHVLKGLRGP